MLAQLKNNKGTVTADNKKAKKRQMSASQFFQSMQLTNFSYYRPIKLEKIKIKFTFIYFFLFDSSVIFFFGLCYRCSVCRSMF